MLVFDAHLDISMNAVEWNRDLTQPLDEIRDRMDQRGIGHVTFQLEPERLHQIERPDQPRV